MVNNISELHGFRSLAIILVVFYHYSLTFYNFLPYNNIVASGWMGVSLFFILSGFLLSSPFIDAAKNNKKFPDVIKFYQKRALRILPLYYFFFFLFIVYNVVSGNILDYKNIFSNLFFVGNHWGISPVIWSLKVEVKFYVVCPLIMLVVFFFIKKKYFYLTSLFLISGLVVPFLYRKSLLSTGNLEDARLNYTSVISNFDSFFYGIIIAFSYSYLKNKNVNDLLKKVVIPIGILLTTLSFLFLAQFKTEHSMFTSSYKQSLLDIIFSLMIILTLMLRKSYWNSLLGTPLMVFIATLSYSLYLFHFWILSIVSNEFKANSALSLHKSHILSVIISLMLTLLFSIISYKYIESPFLKNKNVYANI